MWVDELAFADDQFEGRLVNEPLYVQDLRLGDHVIVKLDEISEWIIIDGDLLLGGFTIHVLRDRMTDEERTQFDAGLGYTFPDHPTLP
jgi:uncharacterized protein YegJ (DUF2314 family)